MAKKGKGSSQFNNLLLVGGLVIGGYFAYETNFLGIKDTIDNLSFDMDDTVGSIAQAVKPTSKYPFRYPYPPTQGPLTQNPTTLPAAHYQFAGAPNLGVMGAGLMANPSLWWDKGAMVPGNRIPMPSTMNYGAYQYSAPEFSTQRYGVQGTNLDYPFLIGPVGPSPCPIGQYRASDGRCYNLPSRPPGRCSPGYYMASDWECYPINPERL